MTQLRYLWLSLAAISAVSLLGIGLLLVRYLPATLTHLTSACTRGFATLINDPIHWVGLLVLGLAICVVAIATSTLLATGLKSWRLHRRLRRLPDRVLPARVGSVLDTHGITAASVELLDSQEPLAFCRGVIRRRIVLSRGLLSSLSPKELEAVLLHEIYHYVNHHPRQILIGELLARTLFFLPIVKELFAAFGREIEIAADQAAVRVQRSRSFIRQALLKSLVTSSLPAFAPFTTDRLEARIAALAKPSPTPGIPVSRKNILATITVLGLTSFLLLSGTNAQAQRPLAEVSCVLTTCPHPCEEPGALAHSSLYSPVSFR